MVNKDQVKGVGKQVKGSVKETAGRVTGNRQTEAEGVAEKSAGKVQKGLATSRRRSSAHSESSSTLPQGGLRAAYF